jgi:hypothetical protein
VAGEVNVPYEGCKAAWDAYEERESLPWMVRVDATVEAAAPYIGRAARIDALRSLLDDKFAFHMTDEEGTTLEVIPAAAIRLRIEKLEADRG